MRSYDPLRPPAPDAWQSLDEQERIDLVIQHHRRAGIGLPNPRAHAAIHVIVENQIALGDELPVRQTLDRLQAEGLDRHDAVHAIGSVLVRHMHDLMASGQTDDDPHARYRSDLAKLTAESWRQSG